MDTTELDRRLRALEKARNAERAALRAVYAEVQRFAAENGEQRGWQQVVTERTQWSREQVRKVCKMDLPADTA
ncbi:hypothetical protein ACFV0B_37920 [Streptomyces xanthophaeus]|uniref:hypothetical protein n=1 Tax=Streptomyces xanthophaeus TaxID=67385 RepID=UPI0036C814A8